MNPQNKDQLHFRLFANCIPVKGAKRAIICDLQRGGYDYIPNELLEVIEDCKNHPLGEVKEAYGTENEQILEEYFEFLLEKEYGFWTDEPTSFPDLNLQWDAPALITNAIIDSDENSQHNFESLFMQLEDMGCKHIQLRFFAEIHPKQLEVVLALTKALKFRSIDLVLAYSPVFDMSYWSKLCQEHLRLNQLIIYNAPHNKAKKVLYDQTNEKSVITALIYQKTNIDSHQHCGIINPAYFAIGMELFTEAQKHNSCLNRKIAVDVSGNIKNCPSMLQSFGNAKHTPLQEAVLKKDFKKYWEIHKDQIEICKDCEFRYICTDCRAFTSDHQNLYSKPAKCQYNPYTATWET